VAPLGCLTGSDGSVGSGPIGVFDTEIEGPAGDVSVRAFDIEIEGPLGMI